MSSLSVPQKIHQPWTLPPNLSVENIVSTCTVKTRLNLKEIALKARNVEYKPRRFPAVVLRLKDPKATCLCFSSGKLVIIGAKTVAASYIAARKFARMLQKIRPTYNNAPIVLADFCLRNFVATYSHPTRIFLTKIATMFHQSCTYEPELFPGLCFRDAEGGVWVMFESGKIIVTGCKTENDLIKTTSKLTSILPSFSRA